MEVLFALPIIMGVIFLPMVAGFMAQSFGRRFWLWFWIAVPFPMIAHCILICLPEKPKEVVSPPQSF
jgi:hypothetical protein